MTVKFRYKKPREDQSRLIVNVVKDRVVSLSSSSDNFRFSAAVAEFGMLLRESEFKAESSYSQAIELADHARGDDVDGYRAEFIEMVKTVSMLVQ